ncbi:Anti-sigma-I factor RsgI6 [Biomphalaria glabrata]|nr:endo-1,4-beta-xylanase 3 [Biomphalaria glabrata]
MFRTVHSLDPTPQLFLNDYRVVANGEYTLAYLSQIQQFKAANVGLGGVGVQSHMPPNTKPSPTLLKHRLDILAQAGVPIWATELDMIAHDENSRADWYEIIWRVFFSHPGVDGIIFWGIWDHDKSPDYGLLHGFSYTLDKAGQRFVHLTKNEWSTHVNRSLSSGTSFNIRGFQGDYDVIVWYKDKPIKKQTFHLGKTDQTVTVDIAGDEHEIQLPPKTDPFAAVPVTHETTSTGLLTMGHATSTSANHQLTCTTRWSAVSAVGDDKRIEVGCNGDEILTGCSSILKNNDWTRDGEKMTMTNGKPVCQAINGAGSSIGTQAVARCCSLSGLSCTYKSAGPAGIGVDDQLVIPCASDGHPLGCAATSWLSNFDGTIFTNTSCIAQNDEPRPTVYGSAACCKGGNIKCSTLVSAPSGQNVGNKASIACPSGQAMTGCNVFTENAKAAGAYIEAQNGADTCIAVNGYPRFGPEKGVQAYITCCHV